MHFLCHEERDFATDIFLQWFVTEQVEEEETVKDIISKLRMIKGEGQGMLVLDRYISPHLYAASRQLAVAIVLRPFSGKEFQKKFTGEWRGQNILRIQA